MKWKFWEHQLSVSETLNQAADLIEREGWTTGNFVSKAGEYCPLGAIAEVRGYSPKTARPLGWIMGKLMRDDAVTALSDYIRENTPRDSHSEFDNVATIYTWNDGCRSYIHNLEQAEKADVVRIMREASEA